MNDFTILRSGSGLPYRTRVEVYHYVEFAILFQENFVSSSDALGKYGERFEPSHPIWEAHVDYFDADILR